MTRPIDADSLKRKLQMIGIKAWKKRITASVEIILNQVIDIVDALPTVDAVPIWFIKSEIKYTEGVYPKSLRILLEKWERKKKYG